VFHYNFSRTLVFKFPRDLLKWYINVSPTAGLKTNESISTQTILPENVLIKTIPEKIHYFFLICGETKLYKYQIIIQMPKVGISETNSINNNEYPQILTSNSKII
jgi:hypothetical protein